MQAALRGWLRVVRIRRQRGACDRAARRQRAEHGDLVRQAHVVFGDRRRAGRGHLAAVRGEAAGDALVTEGRTHRLQAGIGGGRIEAPQKSGREQRARATGVGEKRPRHRPGRHVGAQLVALRGRQIGDPLVAGNGRSRSALRTAIRRRRSPRLRAPITHQDPLGSSHQLATSRTGDYYRAPHVGPQFNGPALRRASCRSTAAAVSPIRKRSTPRAAARPSSIAHTISDWPRDMSPAANTPGTLVALSSSASTLPRASSVDAQLGEQAVLLGADEAHRQQHQLGRATPSRCRASPSSRSGRRRSCTHSTSIVCSSLTLPAASPTNRLVDDRRSGAGRRRTAPPPLPGRSPACRPCGHCGQGLSAARSSGGRGRISNCTRLLQPWRSDVPTQSVPVSPPPMTITSLPLAAMNLPSASLLSSRLLAVRVQELHREVDALEVAPLDRQIARPRSRRRTARSRRTPPAASRSGRSCRPRRW